MTGIKGELARRTVGELIVILVKREDGYSFRYYSDEYEVCAYCGTETECGCDEPERISSQEASTFLAQLKREERKMQKKVVRLPFVKEAAKVETPKKEAVPKEKKPRFHKLLPNQRVERLPIGIKEPDEAVASKVTRFIKEGLTYFICERCGTPLSHEEVSYCLDEKKGLKPFKGKSMERVPSLCISCQKKYKVDGRIVDSNPETSLVCTHEGCKRHLSMSAANFSAFLTGELRCVTHLISLTRSLAEPAKPVEKPFGPLPGGDLV